MYTHCIHKVVDMIDTTVLQIPIHNHLVIPIEDSQGRVTGGETDVKIITKYGVTLNSGSVDYTDADNPQIERLSMPYKSVPSSFSSFAFKLFTGGHNYWPFIEVKASPAKLYQGHNVFFSDCLKTASFILLSEFIKAYPDIGEIADFENVMVKQIDVTYSAKVQSDSIARQVIALLKNIRVGNFCANKSYDTAVMFNAGSAKCVREIYLKEHENNNVLNKLKKEKKLRKSVFVDKQIQALQSETVRAFSKNCVRFEAKVKSEWFKRRGIPTRLKDMISYFENRSITDVWREAFEPILKSLEGANVNIYDEDAVEAELKKVFVKVNAKSVSYNKANRLYNFFLLIKMRGYDKVRINTKESTFYDNLKLLTQVVPLAYLQKFSSGAQENVIPLFRVVNVDFENQLPADYVEPKKVIGL